MFARRPIRSEGWSSSDDGSFWKEFAGEKPLHTQNVKNSHERIAAACRRRGHKTQSPNKKHTPQRIRVRAHTTITGHTHPRAPQHGLPAGWRSGASGAAPTVARRDPRFGAYSVATGTVWPGTRPKLIHDRAPGDETHGLSHDFPLRQLVFCAKLSGKN